MVVLRGFSLRNLVVGDIRNLTQHGGHLFLSFGHSLVQIFRFLFQLRHLSLHLLCLVFLALFHEPTNLAGQLLLLV